MWILSVMLGKRAFLHSSSTSRKYFSASESLRLIENLSKSLLSPSICTSLMPESNISAVRLYTILACLRRQRQASRHLSLNFLKFSCCSLPSAPIASIISLDTLMGGGQGLGSRPSMNPKSMWNIFPSSSISKFSRCRSPIMKKYVMAQQPAVEKMQFSMIASGLLFFISCCRQSFREMLWKVLVLGTNQTQPSDLLQARAWQGVSLQSWLTPFKILSMRANIPRMSWSCLRSSPFLQMNPYLPPLTSSKVSLKGAMAELKMEHSWTMGHFSTRLISRGQATGPNSSQLVSPSLRLYYVSRSPLGKSLMYLDSSLKYLMNFYCCCIFFQICSLFCRIESLKVLNKTTQICWLSFSCYFVFFVSLTASDSVLRNQQVKTATCSSTRDLSIMRRAIALSPAASYLIVWISCSRMDLKIYSLTPEIISVAYSRISFIVV